MTLGAAKRSAEELHDRATVDADVVILGAGPIGIVLSLELAEHCHVVLLDSGSWRVDPAIQELGDAVLDDPYHADMRLASQRRIGGASNLWGGRCVPFDRVDFDVRAIAPDAEWPIGYEEVAAYYQRACDWCRCGRAIFNAFELPELSNRALVPGFVDGDVRASDLERWSLPTNFRKVYGRRLKRHPNIRLITGFTATELCPDGNGDSIRSAQARSIDGTSITLRAPRFIVALGGIESARLLMNSGERPEGLGNRSGHLGHWYMSHAESRIARVRFSTPPEQTIYGHERDADGVFVRRRMTFDHNFQVRERLSNAAIWLVNPDVADASHRNATLSLVYLMLASRTGGRFVAEAIRRKHLKAELSSPRHEHIRNISADWRSAVRFAAAFGYGRFLKPGRRLPGFFVQSASNTYPLDYHGEHLPNWGSYVALADSRDALGMRRLRTHLAYSDSDFVNMRRGLEAIDTWLRDHRLGQVEWIYEDVVAAARQQVYGGFHQSGITRMSSDPSGGVVDQNLTVHGLENLFVASTGVLPTSSQANTTFVAIALAVRLADHLRDQLAPGSAAGRRGLRTTAGPRTLPPASPHALLRTERP